MNIIPNENTESRNRVAGKVAIVAGAGAIGDGWGNGKAAAFVYAKEGAKVLCVDNRLSAAGETVSKIDEIGGEALAWEADVTDEAEVEKLVAACVDRWGTVDILHNNIGGQGTGRKLDTITVDDWNETFTRNVTTTMLTCRAVVPIMERNGGGAIVNISSIAALRHLNVPTAVYSMTKGAMIEFTKNIALQYAAANVRANCVLPGYIDTPFIQRIVNGRPNYEYKGYRTADEYRAARDAIIPSGRMGTGFDVAYASLFLASDEASHITGTHLVVDGGVTATAPGV
jgi:NAD(P)-dependent dehydrogenase (short-subunit alcohol dehydrogenase family)